MFQFYPTPPALAKKAIGKFKSHNYRRILEPQAGRGDLLKPLLDKWSHHYSSSHTSKIDCVEIDFENQAILRSKGLNVIDSDFLTFTGAACYSHIVMNPSFHNGDDHLIKAFNLLVDGELVAILNAETIRNPYTAKRQLICKWIEEHGSVEFLSEAFLDPDTQRKTSVEIALIWLHKKLDVKANFTTGLEFEHVAGLDFQEKNSLALRQNTISNAVAVFNAAVQSLKTAEVAREEADYYARLLGRPLNELHKTAPDGDSEAIHDRFNKGYDELKQRAWTNVLHSTEFDKYLSSKAYQRLTTEFENIAKLSFTESNIRSFLIGLINNQGDMNIQMLLDCFDEITKYRPENRAYFKGWKSNEKHRELAYRVKMTRFILPVRNYHGIPWEFKKLMQDFDKVFAMLDGKLHCDNGADHESKSCLCFNGLYALFDSWYYGPTPSKRHTTEYFDIRFYSGVGTVHIYPRRKDLIDRLNRLVGKERQWLPQDDTQATKTFWQHYEKAETITNAMVVPAVRWGQPSEELINNAHTDACNAAGYDLSTMFQLNGTVDVSEVA